ncbi:ABC transporter permease [Rhodococcoides kyotonense]|uniref:Peptide/nickel transport system permease protein n=1 Tax=Rhodococcoides kyotonense TaxID=398843 RepID=A0A239MAZ3_9NOCA|nr:ABC transporter permease [Rhodococcus kyotonensis]SNT39886.1 peptide/nickel transport system permease protein [Rhodococcus kyotonensis]
MTLRPLTRVAHVLLVVWGAFTITFVTLFLLPSDAVAIMYVATGTATDVDPAELDRLRTELGLDRSPIEQYLDYVVRYLGGDFGNSVRTGEPVREMMFGAIANTAILASIALAVGVSVGFVFALVVTRLPEGGIRSSLTALPTLGLSVASFIVALTLLQIFSFQLRVLPAFGSNGPATVVLPSITLAIPVAAAFAQLLIRGLESALDSDYVLAARAAGESESRVQIAHALRNALPASIAQIGILMAGLFGGTVIVETIYGRTGLGRLLADSVTNRDLPVILGITVLAALTFAVTGMLTDTVNSALDPRLDRRRRGKARV